MPNHQAWPEQLVLRLDERSLRGFAKLRRGAGALQVFVPYTSPDLTKVALSRAKALTRNLAARITLLDVHVVPFPLPLEKPNVAVTFLERKLISIAKDAGAEVEPRVVFARDRGLGTEQALAPNSLVLIATKKRWWPTAEVKLGRSLARAGHSVALLGV